ncbi:hypothetical protein [Streptomyces sp. G-G2]|uniref:hypothetical protein n=1 Tax=Streptomyces sp. G-G2 TaxID=3046201 RepID=UPI0024BBC096|nr:hypothetical protein [Streptomyces sp. G-G2]MDJ0383531.1 hypothetical protein [Streptomyces sp. G-G2]
MRGTCAASATVVLVVATLAGCGASGSPAAADPKPPPAPAESNPPGDIPDNQVYVVFKPPTGGFTVSVPEGWARTSTGPVTAFTDKLNRIEVSERAAAQAPTIASVTARDVPALAKAVSGFAPGKASEVTRKSGKALLYTYQGNTAPDPVTGKAVRDAFERYVFHHDSRDIVLTLSGPVTADNVDPWRTVTDSLRWP